MKNVNVIIKRIEDYNWAKKELSDKQIKFLNTKFQIEYNEKTTIRQILRFYAHGLREYYTRDINSKDYFDTDIFLQNTFELIIKNKVMKIIDVDVKIENLLKYQENNTLEIVYLIGVGGGFEALESCNGIKYWMNTHEQGKHNEPHIHIKYAEEEVVVNILNETILTGKVRNSKLKEAIDTVKRNKMELICLWNTKTDGIKVDINSESLYLGC